MHVRRLQRAFRTLPDLERLPIAIAPQSVRPASRGQVEQPFASEARRVGARCRQGESFDVAFFHRLAGNRNTPQIDLSVYDAGGQAAGENIYGSDFVGKRGGGAVRQAMIGCFAVRRRPSAVPAMAVY